MAKYEYTALVTTRRTHAVKVTVEVPGGKSPWGPTGRAVAKEAALKAGAVAEYTGAEPQVSTDVQFTHAQEA